MADNGSGGYGDQPATFRHIYDLARPGGHIEEKIVKPILGQILRDAIPEIVNQLFEAKLNEMARQQHFTGEMQSGFDQVAQKYPNLAGNTSFQNAAIANYAEQGSRDPSVYAAGGFANLALKLAEALTAQGVPAEQAQEVAEEVAEEVQEDQPTTVAGKIAAGLKSLPARERKPSKVTGSGSRGKIAGKLADALRASKGK